MMIRRPICAALLGAALLGLPLPVTVTPAQAQRTVYDPWNHAENILSAARALDQINNQIASLQNEAQMLVNQSRNLTSLPYSTLARLQQSFNQTQALIARAQRLAYEVTDIERAFGLFGKTAFLAERVLGNVVSSGVKVLVLAVIIGIGSTLFAQFTAGFGANQPTIDEAMSIVLAALALLALGIFGPGIANGLISGGPQLSAGAAVGTGLAVGGAAVAGAAVARIGLAAVGAAGSAAGATARGAAYTAGATGTAYRSGGAVGIAKAAGSAAMSPLRSAAGSLRGSHAAGSAAVSGGGLPLSDPPPSSGAPAWARRMRRGQALSHGVTTLGHAIRSGDGGGAGSSIRLSEDR